MEDAYRSISLFSITPDDVLPFSLAIHYKGRYLPYLKPGECLEVSRFNRFVYKRIGTLFVPSSEFPEYEAYIARRKAEEQKSLSDPGLTPEKRFSNKIALEMKHATRDLFMFDSEADRTEAVKRMLTVTRQTVEQVLAKPYVRVFESLPENANDIIAHSTRVSLISTYIAYQCGYVNPVSLEYLAAAAMLHDIGKTKLDLSGAPSAGDESEQMKQHPKISCEMLKSMQFVPSDVLRIVAEHHECRDGSGYPQGLRGPNLLGLSGVFVIANTFDNLVSQMEGTRESKTRAALQRMTTEMRSKFDPVLLAKSAKVLETGLV